MRFKQLLLVSIVAMALNACSEQEPRTTPNTSSQKTQSTTAPNVQPAQSVIANTSAPIAIATPTEPSEIIAPLGASTVITQTIDGRQMVVSADLNFETGNVQKTTMQVEELAKRHAGFIVFSEIKTYTSGSQAYPKPDGNTLNITRYSHEGSMTVRVPRDKSSEFIKDLQQVIEFLQQQEFKAEDVSLTLRKQMLEAQRQQELAAKLDEFKRSKQATAQTEADIRAEFDKKARENEATLQQEFWRDKMAYATITLRFRQPEGVMQELQPNLDALAKQHRPNVGVMAWNGIKQGWDYIMMMLIFLLGYWPITLGIPAALIGIRVARKIRSRRLARKLAEAVQTSRRRQYADDEIDDFD